MNGQAERPDTDLEEEVSEAESEVAASDGEDSGAPDPEDALAAAEAEAAENWERYVRAVAEVENVRKRAARDVEKARKFALERFGKELLVVIDGLEMALASSDNATVESLLEGSEATLKLLVSTLERFGIEVVDPEGEPFDPEWHEAISVQASDMVEPGSVITVLQKGYSLNGRLLRPAMVIVSAD
jgi:molecular chaperone GrpE